MEKAGWPAVLAIIGVVVAVLLVLNLRHTGTTVKVEPAATAATTTSTTTTAAPTTTTVAPCTTVPPTTTAYLPPPPVTRVYVAPPPLTTTVDLNAIVQQILHDAAGPGPAPPITIAPAPYYGH